MYMAASTVHIICVGAVYIDTIWKVPHFPKEDTKLRAQTVTRRRGGNTANTLEVLSDLLTHDANHSLESTKLHLIAVLPEQNSQDGNYIQASIPDVDLTSSLFRKSHQHAASSMIIQSKKNDTRTIVSHGGGLPEMTCKEFIDKFQSVVADEKAQGKAWVHFEGRIPDVISDCVEILRRMYSKMDLMISVECEKPDRRGLDRAAEKADMVFYSKLWAEERYGDTSPVQFLKNQISRLNYEQKNVILVCTWGAKGAVAVKIGETPDENEWAKCEETWYPSDSPDAKVVDTVGAGDTFVAGMLYQLTQRPGTTLEHKVRYTVQLASRKVFQDGFGRLGAAMNQASF